MRTLVQIVTAGVLLILSLLFDSCKKDPLSEYDTATVNMLVSEDDSIALPVTIVAGDGCLLNAYSTSSGKMKFSLTDNNGRLMWQKQFGVTKISKILWERDGTFTIITTNRLINITREGSIKKNIPFLVNIGLTNLEIFNVFLNKKNNYIISGMSHLGNLQSNSAFVAEVMHNGSLVFNRTYMDTILPPTGVYLGNYDAITGGVELDDGGYIFFGNFYYGYNNGSTDQITFNIIRTNSEGIVIWQRNNILLSSLDNPYKFPLPYNTDIYGFHNQSYTHEILPTSDNNFLCFFNVPDYQRADQRARVYKIDHDGRTIDSAFIDFSGYNRFSGGLANSYKVSTIKTYACGNGVVKNVDNTFSMCMQTGFFGCKGLTNSYIRESQTFVVRIDENLNVLNTQFLQNNYSDCFNSVCKTSDGRTVYFGLISSFGSYYRPAMIFHED